MGALVAELLDEQPLDSAVVDAAHLGDIHGAFGTLRWRQLWPVRTWRRRLAVLATVMGPGLVALLADNDAGGIATYGAAGRDGGTRLLWLLLPLGVVLFLNQEMAARLGAVSGVGHARLITARFGRLWGAFSVADLLLLNALTLVTEFIGVRFAAAHMGIAPAPAVGLAALVLIGATLGGGFRRWERVMYVLVAVDVVLIPLLLLSHPSAAAAGAGTHTGRPHALVLLVVALVGTTISPWQLFFQQSAVVDKRITPRWLGYARLDTAVGTVLWLGGAAAVMSLGVAGWQRGTAVGGIFALFLLDGALLGAAALAMATSYAVGDVTGARHSLHRTPREAPLFYGVAVAVVVAAAGVVLLPGLSLGFTTVFVQVLAGLLTPSATLFLLLLCNDTAVLGPWSNPGWLNALVSTIIAGLLVLSGMLVMTALFPHAPVVRTGYAMGGAAAAALVAVALLGARRRRRLAGTLWTDPAATPRLRLVRASDVVVLPCRARAVAPLADERAFWRTPPLSELRRPVWSTGRLAGMVALRAYMVGGVLLLAGRAVAMALGH